MGVGAWQRGAEEDVAAVWSVGEGAAKSGSAVVDWMGQRKDGV